MKPNVIVALLVGLVVGFTMGTMVSGGPRSSGPSALVETANAGPGRGSDESMLAIKSADMPAGTFTDMTEQQKYDVMKVMNDNECDCGCGKGSYATCVKTDPGCPKSPAMLRRMVEMARSGKNAVAIQQEIFGGPSKAVAAAKPKPAQGAADTTVYKVPVDNAAIQGPANALVTIVEFSDYQCPFCTRANATVNQLLQQYAGKIRLAYRQNPLTQLHPQAMAASQAAIAAGEQGKYWEMHELLFAHQQQLDDASLEGYAKQIGLDIAKWKAAKDSQKTKDIIAKDMALSQSLGASGTPAFFINGRKLSGAQPIDNFKKIIDEELAKAEELVKNGTRPQDVYAKVMEKGVTAPPAAPAAAAQAPAGGIKKVDVPADSPSKGPKFAKVTIVEWSDFQCPFCSRAVPVLKQILEAYPKDVKVVFRHQPLPFHSNAQISAEASMAAHEQGKFWEMHDKMFANAQQLDRASLEKYAQELGLDMAKFKAALDSGKYRDRVKADSVAGSAVGANGTPTFYFNGREQIGSPSFEQAKAMIDQEIAKADKLLASGVKMENLYAKLLESAPAAPAPGPNVAAAGAPSGAPVKIDVGNAPAKGPKNAPVTIVLYSDFQCPFCSRAVPTLKTLEEQYKGKIRIAFKNQPLPFHPNAKPAAVAALAANEQGKFWEFHDKLFANQQQLDRAHFEQYAQELGLDMNRFKAALDRNKFDAQIAAEQAEAGRVGADGTPTFFINGRQLVGAQPVDQFKAIIDEELKKAKK